MRICVRVCMFMDAYTGWTTYIGPKSRTFYKSPKSCTYRDSIFLVTPKKRGKKSRKLRVASYYGDPLFVATKTASKKRGAYIICQNFTGGGSRAYISGPPCIYDHLFPAPHTRAQPPAMNQQGSRRYFAQPGYMRIPACI